MSNDAPRRQPDIYGRRPTSDSRGRTHDRILSMQHAPGTVPGAEHVLAERPDGSFAHALMRFHAEHVAPLRVTARRSGERALALVARDLDARGVALTAPARTVFDRDVCAAHLTWRVEQGMIDAGELKRAALLLARLGDWLVEQGELDADQFVDARAWLRGRAAELVEAGPPAFHVAARADELRDTSDDASVLAPDA